mmetsp:Transcript_99549/g.319507  ORF Transcript_99549/g.319507 Transcript_99549/m.319507 type:complete len:299 (-) Transcript_99549:658-1554(-)
MSSLYSKFSALRCSVASATDLSSSMMPASRAAISCVVVSMPSFALAMAVSASAILRSRAFLLSSVWSNCMLQYSFLLSSSSCSFFNIWTISSHILMTLSNVPWLMAFLPLKVSAIMSRAGRRFLSAFLCMARSKDKAWERSVEAETRTCTKLALELGNVFLKKSSASSSFKTLIVSAKATSSSALVLERSSHSFVLVPQLDSSSARNFLSSNMVAAVSERSSFICTMATPSSPIRVVFVSTVAVRAWTSFSLAAISASKVLTDAASVAVSSARSFAMVSPISFKIPVIWPLCGAYPEP